MNEDTPKTEEELLVEADRLAAEVEASIGDFSSFENLEGLDQIPPELLEQLTPEQIQTLLGNMANAVKKPRSFYTRKQSAKSQRRKKRNVKKRARAVTRRAGWGRTISRKKRLRKAL